jgi:hypothetical protein
VFTYVLFCGGGSPESRAGETPLVEGVPSRIDGDARSGHLHAPGRIAQGATATLLNGRAAAEGGEHRASGRRRGRARRPPTPLFWKSKISQNLSQNATDFSFRALPETGFAERDAGHPICALHAWAWVLMVLTFRLSMSDRMTVVPGPAWVGLICQLDQTRRRLIMSLRLSVRLVWLDFADCE